MSVTTPTVKVEISQTAPTGTQTWVDETAYVRAELGVTMSHGRADEESQVTPGRLSLTLDNTTGRFTYGVPNAQGSSRWPGQRIRVSVWNGVSYAPRFDGTVDGWPVSWAELTPLVQIGATDRLKLLSRQATSGGLWETSRRLGAVRVTPFTDASTSTTTFGPNGEMLTDNVRTFSALGPAPAVLTPAAADAPADGGKVATITGGIAGADYSSWSMLAVANDAFGGSTHALTWGIWVQYAASGYPEATIAVQTGGSAVAIYLHSTSVELYCGGTLVTGPNINDLGWHHLGMTCNSGTGAWTLYVDGVAIGSGATAETYSLTSYLGMGSYGTTGSPSVWNGSFAHAVALPTTATAAQMLQLYQAGYGYFDETTDERIARALTSAGVDAADMSLETGYMMSRSVATPLAVSEQVKAAETSDGGVFFADGTGDFVFHNHAHRHGATAGLTIPAWAVGTDFRVDADDSKVQNLVTYTRQDGGAAVGTAVMSNSVSVARYGTTPGAVSLELAKETDFLASVGDDFVARSDVRPRAATLTLDVLTLAAYVPGILALEIGDLIRVTTLPSGADFTECHVFVEGWTESLAPDKWEIKFATSPGWTGAAGVFGTAQFGNANAKLGA